jgi:hypothetical protein
MGDDHWIRPDNDVVPELVAIEGDDIVIRITAAALTFGTEHCPLLETQQRDSFRRVRVTDLAAWRAAVVRALRRESENGDTPVHLLLDNAVFYAAEHGEEGISIDDGELG